MIEPRLWRDGTQPGQAVQPVPQAGALCYRLLDHGPEILLITTRRSGKWIVPKGGLIDGKTPSETAGQEAWEEAGVTGEIGTQPIGDFLYCKSKRKRGAIWYQVAVFPLLAHEMACDYPEIDERLRQWYSPQQAAERVSAPQLAHLLRRVGFFAH